MNTVGQRTLVVDSNTLTRDLHGLASSTSQDSIIRGRMVDGKVQLYTKPDSHKFGMLSKLSPSAIYHRHLAKKAIATILKNDTKTGEDVGKLLMSRVKTPVGRDMKAGTLNVAAALAAFRPTKQDGVVMFGDTVGPTSDTLGLKSDAVKAVLNEAAEAIVAKRDLAEVTGKLGDLLTKAFEASNPSDQARRDFNTSLGGAERKELMTAMKMLVYPGRGVNDLRAPDLKPLLQVVQGAYNQAAARAIPDQFEGDFKFSFGGVSFEAPPTGAPVGQGGFGVVREFWPSDGSQSVAVKVGHPSDDPEVVQNNMAEALKEIDLHKRVEGEGHPNVTQMKGAIRLPNGGFAIILEMARFGNLKGFSGKLGAAVDAGVVTRQDALLAQRSAVRDQLQGIAHSHANGMMNQDVKDENYLVMADGTIKLADNGGARERDGYDFSLGTNTPDYLSPEALNQSEVKQELSVTLGETRLEADLDGPLHRAEGVEVQVFGTVPRREGNPNDEAIRSLVSKSFPKASEQELQSLVESYRTAMEQQILDRQLSPEKRDGYALGLAAEKLVYTKDMHAGATVRPGETSGYGAEVIELRDLVTKLSDKDVASRISPEDALSHKAVDLTPEEVASARDIIKKVGNWSVREANKAVPLPSFQTPVRAPSTTSASPAPSSSQSDVLTPETTPEMTPNWVSNQLYEEDAATRPRSVQPTQSTSRPIDVHSEMMEEISANWTTNQLYRG